VTVNDIYGVSTTKSLFIVKGVYNETLIFEMFKKYANVIFQVLWISCLLQEFKFPPKCLGYLTGHRRGAPAVLTEKCTDFLK
jgi:hypothetical protein